RKRRGEEDDSGQPQKRSRLLASGTDGSSEPESPDLEESGTLFFELGKKRNCFWRAGVRLNWEQNQQHPLVSRAADNSAELLASDDNVEPRDSDGYVRDKPHVLSGSLLSSAWPAPTIRCPICMDFYPQIMQSGRLILSTLCGHVFCSQCLPVALQTANFCPTCRTDLTPEQYHPIYI
ncbi:RNF4 ligase, partial [Pachycephala philippinensis]|nr:RNF4 ligase [Pachycephala philippinensis]